MTRLVALCCAACQAPLAATGARIERVFCCPGCATATDLAEDGPHPYPIRTARAAPGTDDDDLGLYWSLTGTAKITAFAATEAATTTLGTVEKADQVLPFAIDVPMRAQPIADCHRAAVKRVGTSFDVIPWTAPTPGATQPIGAFGRREAERVAHQVIVYLITRAPGSIHCLELALDVQRCDVVLMVK